MLYHLLYPLSHYISGFNVFKYITFRTAYASVTAMLISFIFGAVFIQYLRRKQVKESIRKEGPQSHMAKEGTPTMGGLLILIAIIFPTLLWADLSNTYIHIVLLVTISMGHSFL
jgi:phospho-N-acetylmuramoyl-pentapeptide-transferase